MEIVENTLEIDMETFLRRPLFCFLAMTDNGIPRVSPFWFLWENGAIWIIGDEQKTYPDRIRDGPETALAIIDFERTTGRVQHVGMRGTATIEPHDSARAERLLSQYLGPEKSEWDRQFFGDPEEWGDEMMFIRFEPETVVARDQSYAAAPSVAEQ